MADLLDKIIEAKEKIGDEAALIIANHLGIENFSEQKLKGSCPFGHSDSTPSFIWDKEQKMFHCFAGETKIITKNGIKSISDIVDTPVEVINGNGEWETVIFRSYGKQKLLKLTLTSNNKQKTIYATPEHEWIVQKHKNKIQTQNLHSGNRLERMWIKRNEYIKIDTEGLRHGFIYGDGHINKQNKNTFNYQMFIYNEDKYNFASKIFDIVRNKSTDSRNSYGMINYTSKLNYKNVPDYNTYSKEYLLGFLAGYFAADGNCSKHSISISNSNKDDLIKIKHICTILGIATYSIGETIRNENSNGGIISYNREYPIYILRIVKSTVPDNFYVSAKKPENESVYKSYLGYTVVSVEETDRFETVYCTVTSTHSFVLEDFILTGNCFSCGRNYSILDMYTDIEGSYLKALKRLFSETDIEFNVKEVKQNREEFFKNYVYPEEETNTERNKVENYLGKRGISNKTLDYAGIKQDKYGNIVFEFRDLDDTLLSVKYRKAGKVKKKEPKMWYQKDKSNCPILYNINKIDITRPLLIIEGEIDVLSCIEAGFTNVVSIPHGASDTTWIEFNYDFLEQFEEIIVWFDNDKAGQLATNNTVSRLGEYRCKLVKPDKECEDAVEKYYKAYDENVVVRKTDANNVLLACGGSTILRLINSAEEIPSKRLKYLMDCEMVDVKDMEKVTTGFKSLDRILYGNLFPCFSIITGYTGSGKSSLANIMSVIAPVENDYKTFIFSGELAEGQLLNWIVSPLAGYNHTIEWRNSENGSKGYSVTKEAEDKIREYYRKNIILYSDADELDTSGETILNEMENAYKRYGCKVFLIDNLMCINFEDLSDNESKWSSQKQFIIKLMKFTNKYGVNVNLILHPRKPNQAQSQTAYDLHGASEIGNLCHRLLWINRLKDDPTGFNIEIKIVKDRPTGKGNESCKMNYDTKTHRIYSDRTEQRQAYKWEEEANIIYSDYIKQRLICNLPDDDPNPQMDCDQM